MMPMVLLLHPAQPEVIGHPLRPVHVWDIPEDEENAKTSGILCVSVTEPCGDMPVIYFVIRAIQ